MPVNTRDLERLLIAGRPEPPAEFVDALEERLWPAPSAPHHRRPRLVFAGAAADARCQTVIVERWRRVPVFQRARDGTLLLLHRRREVPQAVRRCR